MLPELVDFFCRHNLYTANLDGCVVGLADSAGVPIKKPWRFVCSKPTFSSFLGPVAVSTWK
eukprot:7566087-Karenia_brevis.AAC.1